MLYLLVFEIKVPLGQFNIRLTHQLWISHLITLQHLLKKLNGILLLVRVIIGLKDREAYFADIINSFLYQWVAWLLINLSEFLLFLHQLLQQLI